MCLVWALKVYMSRTALLQKGMKLLFVSFKPGNVGDVHKNTLSSWVKNLLHFTYSSALQDEDVLQLSNMQAHEGWALSSSLAFRSSLDMESILQASTWKMPNTFISHYLTDISTLSGDLHLLGSIVAAQQIVHSS